MNSASNSQKENIARGCLKLNNKIYPVYDGLNTVGRNPGAVINIKNLNISQQHAVITIVDENLHFISDFKSSNGTILDNKKLNPLKLYKLDNGASIKFADIFCTYKKLDHNELVLDNLEESQSLDDNFYTTNTQRFDLPSSEETIINDIMFAKPYSVHEMPTQVMSPPPLSLNEMPTQVMSPRALSINEMPTQVFNFNDSGIKGFDESRDASSSDSVDFATMQKATQSQGFTLNKDESDSDTEPPCSFQSDIHPVKLNSKKNPLNSESDKLIATPEIEEPTTSNADEENLSQICPVKTGKKNVLESDSESDSDTEEYVPPNRRRSRYDISDDDETDIEDANTSAEADQVEDNIKKEEKVNETLNNTDIIPTTQETVNKVNASCSNNLDQSSLNSFRLELSEVADEPDGDHIYCQKSNEGNANLQNIEENLLTTEVSTDPPVKNASVEDHIYCKYAETQQDEATTESKNIEEEKEEVIRNGNVPKSENSILQTVEKLMAIDQINESSLPQSEEPSTSKAQNLNEDTNEDGKTTMADTGNQPIQDLADTQSVVSGKGEDLDQLTEELGLFNDQQAEDKKDEDKGVDLTFASDPMLSGICDKNDTNIEVEEKGTNEEHNTENCDFIQPTEPVDSAHDDMFDQPTQELELDFVKDKEALAEDDKVDDDIYLQATQKMKSDDGQKDNIVNGPKTNILEPTKDEEDLYFLPTQQLIPDEKKKDHEFARPFERFTSPKKSVPQEDEEDFLPPTQALEYLHKEEAGPSTSKQPDVSDQNSNKVEDQLEMLFYSQSDHRFVATQQLVDVLEAKNDEDIIDDSIIEESCIFSNKKTRSKNPVFNSVDSIREVLDDHLENVDGPEEEQRVLKTTDEVEELGEPIDNADRVEEIEEKKNDKIKEKTPKNPSENSKSKTVKQSKGKDKKQETTTKKTEDNAEHEGSVSTRKRTLRDTGKIKETSVKTKTKKKNETNDYSKTETARKNREGSVASTSSDKTEENSEASDSMSEGKGDNVRTRRMCSVVTETTEKDTRISNKKYNTERNVNSIKTVGDNNADSVWKTIEEKEDKVKTRREGSVASDISEKSNDSKPATKRQRAIEKVKQLEDNQQESSSSIDNIDTTKQINTRTRRKEIGSNDSDQVDEFKSKMSTRKQTLDTKKDESSTKKGKKTVADAEMPEDNSEESNSSDKITALKEIHTRTRSRKEGSVASDTSDHVSESNPGMSTRKQTVTKTKDANEKKVYSSKKGKTTASVSDSEKSEDNIEKVNEIKEIYTRTRRKEGSVTSDTSDQPEQINLKMSTRKQTGDKTKEAENARTKESVKADISEKQNEDKMTTRSRPIIKKDDSDSDDLNKPSTSKTPTRKRTLKTTELDSGDEFEAKVSKIESSKKISTNQKTETKKEAVVVPETPTQRKSTRARKVKSYDDDVISLSSSSSSSLSKNEVISVSSTSVEDEPVKKARRLSANSRLLKIEEEKSKQKETPVQKGPSSIPATPERNKRQLKPKVVFTMMDNPELESLIRQLGGSVVDTVDAATVLVTESVKRSQKLLCAVGQSKPICSPQWLYACKKAHSFVDPWDYILVDKEAEKKWDFSLQESLMRSRENKLLQDYTFQIIVNNAADVLKGAIEACGGKCVTRNLAKSNTANIMIVSTSDNKNKFTKIVNQNPKIKVVEPEAIFDGTLRQEFRFNKYFLK